MIDAIFAALDPGMNGLLGSETATLRRSLRLERPDGHPAVDLLAADPAPLGATVVRLRAAEGRLDGHVGAGLTLTAGASAYLVARDCQRAPDGTVAVSLASPLLAAVAAGDSVTLSEEESWDLPHCLAYKPLETVLSGDLVGAVSFALSVPLATMPQRPAFGDVVTASLGSGPVLGFLPGDGGSVEVLVGRAGTPATDVSKRQVPARSFA